MIQLLTDGQQEVGSAVQRIPGAFDALLLAPAVTAGVDDHSPATRFESRVNVQHD